VTTEPSTVPRVVRLEVSAIPSAARLGRDIVRGLLGDWRVDRTVIEDAELVAGELVANAIKATTTAVEAAGAQHRPMPPVAIEVELDGDVVRIGVEDSSPAAPVPQDATDDAENGRGLFLVEALSARWGVCFMVDGKTAWAELLLVPATPCPATTVSGPPS
jgi:anti-sigma regulatory factor (Ser/Thr protein kinase)